VSLNHPDIDAKIAAALSERNRRQAEFDKVKHSYDSSSIIDARFALDGANRRLLELRGQKEADRPVESARNSSIFFGSNS
jgi:hypothetical protein